MPELKATLSAARLALVDIFSILDDWKTDRKMKLSQDVAWAWPAPLGECVGSHTNLTHRLQVAHLSPSPWQRLNLIKHTWSCAPTKAMVPVITASRSSQSTLVQRIGRIKLDASFNSLSLPPLAPSQAMHVATVKSSKACCRCSDQLGSLNYAYKGHTRIKVAVMCKYLAFINRNLSVCRGASSARNLAQQTTCWSSVMLRDHDFWSFLRALCFPTKSLHRTQSRIEGNIFVIVIHFLH